MILPIIITSVATYFLGWLWYSPHLFGQMWMKAKGLTPESMDTEDMRQAMITGFVGAFVINLIQITILAATMRYFGITTPFHGALFAGLMSFAFCFLHAVNASLWGEKNWPLLLINTGHDFATATVAGALIGYMLSGV